MSVTLGGARGFAKFEDLCCKIYLCLRRHVPVFFNLLVMLTDDTVQPRIEDISPQYLRIQLCNKFYPTLLDEEAGIRFRRIVRNAPHHPGQKIDTYWGSLKTLAKTYWRSDEKETTPE